MENYTQRVEELGHDPQYRNASTNLQREQYLSVLQDELLKDPGFAEASQEAKSMVMEEMYNRDFAPAYANFELKDYLDKTKEAYLAGDPNAREAMITYSQRTEYSDRLTRLGSKVEGMLDPLAVAERFGMPGEYANSPLNLTKTFGADDNRARQEILNMFRETGDLHAEDQVLGNEALKMQAFLLSAAEEVGFAVAANIATGGAASANYLSKAGKVGSWFARNSPSLVTEAGLEGIRGALEYEHQMTSQGERPDVAGAVKAFGLYAGMDVMISHAATALLGQVGKGAKSFREAQEFLEASDNVTAIAKGQADIPNMLSEPHVRHEAATRMYWDTNAKMKENTGYLDHATPLEKANYDGFEAGYRVTANAEGNYIVQKAGKPAQAEIFPTTTAVNDFIGEKAWDSVESLVREGRVPEAIAFMERHPGFRYGQFEEVAASGWKVTEPPSRDFVDPSLRQHVNEVEFADTSTAEGTNLVRFQEEYTPKQMDEGKTVFRRGDTLDVTPNQDGNSAVHVSAMGTRADYEKALQVANARKAEHTMPDSVEALARDEMIKGGYDAVDMGDGKIKILQAQNTKIINNKVNPKTGRMGKIEYDVPAKKSVGDAQVAQKGVAEKAVVTTAAEAQGPKAVAEAQVKVNVQKAAKAPQKTKGPLLADAFSSPEAKKMWLDYVTRKTDRIASPLTKTDAGWTIGIRKSGSTIPITKVYTSETADQVFRDVVALGKVPQEIGADLAANGFELFNMTSKAQFPNRQWKVLTKRGKELGIYSDNDLFSVYDALGVEPSMPTRLLPTKSIISDIPDVNFIAKQEVSLGNAYDAAMFQGNFKAPETGKVIAKKADGRKIVKVRKARIKAEIPELNHTEIFETAAEAQRYVNKEWYDSEFLQKAAEAKGLRLGYARDGWKLYGKDNILTGKTKAEIIKEMSKVKTPTAAKEFLPDLLLRELDNLGFELELPPGFTRMTNRVSDMIPRASAKMLDSSPALWNSLMPAKQAIRRMIREVDPQGTIGLGKAYERMLRQMDFARNKTYQDAHEIAGIFKGYDNKVEARKGIFHYLEATEGADQTRVIKEWSLTDEDVGVARKLESYYERKSAEIGIPFQKLIKEYQPHMRDWASKTKAAKMDKLLTAELKADDPKLYTYLKDNPFMARAQEERLLDGLQAWMDEDSMRVALRYSGAENRAFYANEATQEFYSMLKKNSGAINNADNGLIQSVNNLREMFTNPGAVFQMDAVNKTIQKAFGKIMPKATAGNPAAVLISLPSLTNMTLRAWLPLRNMFQVFTVGGLRTGNLLTTGKAISKLPTRQAFKDTIGEMMDKGIIPKQGAMTNEYLQMVAGAYDQNAPKLIELMRKGLNLYALSDDWTRAVMYHASNDIFDKAVRKSTVGGKLNVDSMVKRTMMDTLDPIQTQSFREMLDAGNVAGARDLLSKYNIEFTMFDYGAMNKPMGANSLFGQIYYQMGTFSLNFSQSLLTTAAGAGRGGLGNATKALMAMGVGMGAVALGAKALGINNSSFLAYKMVGFSGGPWIDIMKDVQEMSEPGIRGSMARRALSRTFMPVGMKDGKLAAQYPAIIPGSLHFKYLTRAVERFREGDYWGVAMALGTVPEYKE